jgi:hypothetical protein
MVMSDEYNNFLCSDVSNSRLIYLTDWLAGKLALL